MLAHDGVTEEQLAVDVDMWWHQVAAELECGVIDETGEYVGGADRLEAEDGRLPRLDAPPSREPCGLGDCAVRSTATAGLTSNARALFAVPGDDAPRLFRALVAA